MSDFEKSINASDLIDWIMCAFPDWCVGDVRKIVDHVNGMPPAQPKSDKEKISDLLRRLYLIQSAHLTKEGIVRKQHYCEELWTALFHDDEFPVWMHWS